MIGRLVGLRARDVLNEVYLYREHCIAKGKMADSPFDGPLPPPAPDIEGKITEIEQAWNEFHSTWTTVVPSDESELAGTLSEAIASCSAELETGDSFEAERDGRFVPVERHAADNSVGRMLVGICNKGPQGGGLGRQIDEVAQRAGEHTPVIVRSTAFPANPKSAGLAAARKADRPGRPARGRRGLRLAHHDGAGRVPLGPRHRRRPRLRGLAQAEPALDRPHVVARDPRPGSTLRARPEERSESGPTAGTRGSGGRLDRFGSDITRLDENNGQSTETRTTTAPGRSRRHRYDQRPPRRAGGDRTGRADAACCLPGCAGQRQDDGRAGGGRAAPGPGNPGNPGRPQGRPVRLRPARYGAAHRTGRRAGRAG